MEVVIGCRVSPKQKGDIVALMRMRHPDKVTLAIGDGANDCAMISRAHVGVGIAGKEGMQAARSSDFAIGKFKFLQKLLFVHGREAYRRNGELILFMFYKNVLFVMVQFIFGYYSIFSGQTMFEKWICQFYNVTFTGLHVIVYALFDFQFEKHVLMATPVLYSIGMRSEIYNMKEFWIWFTYACAQAVMVLTLAFVLPESSPTTDGKSFTFWAGGHHVYMNCVLLANLMILKMQHNYTGFNVIIISA
jgi:phospholipid-transporting ATPase